MRRTKSPVLTLMVGFKSAGLIILMNGQSGGCPFSLVVMLVKRRLRVVCSSRLMAKDILFILVWDFSANCLPVRREPIFCLPTWFPLENEVPGGQHPISRYASCR